MVDFFEALAYRANGIGIGIGAFALNFKTRAMLSSMRPCLERLCPCPNHEFPVRATMGAASSRFRRTKIGRQTPSDGNNMLCLLLMR